MKLQDGTDISPEKWARKMLTDELAEYLLAHCHSTYSANAVAREAVRRLKDVDNVICWGVECVHQAKELDKSYADYRATEIAIEALTEIDSMRGNVISSDQRDHIRIALTALQRQKAQREENNDKAKDSER
jgi:hypothetical protein